MKIPVLYIVVPCYNESDTLQYTAPLFLEELTRMIQKEKVSDKSRILFVDDGSSDSTWEIISVLCKRNEFFEGVSLSRNQGHQNALYAGIMEAKDKCDIIITADCDGQDDITAVEKMVDGYISGSDIVYGVRKSRKTDSFAKKSSAGLFYRFMKLMGVETVYNHADYRLITSEVAEVLSEFTEVNLYLRGIIPLIGFNSSVVEYDRKERKKGESHYTIRKMVSLAINAITGFSVRPLRLISVLGFFVSMLSFVGIIWILIQHFNDNTVSGWSSTLCIVCFVSGVQLLSLGVVGEYIGKIYMEVKNRPRYIINKRAEKSLAGKENFRNEG